MPTPKKVRSIKTTQPARQSPLGGAKTKVKPVIEKAVKAKALVKPAKPAKVTAQTAKVEKPAKVEKIAKPTAKTTVVGTFNVTGKAAELIKKYQRNKEDTGSTEVQIALFTAKIEQLSKHLKKHTKDSDSKRGILIMVGKRRRLLTFLQKTDLKSYESLIADLGLRK